MSELGDAAQACFVDVAKAVALFKDAYPDQSGEDDRIAVGIFIARMELCACVAIAEAIRVGVGES